MFNGEQVNAHIEQDDHVDNVIEDDGTNTLIHDSLFQNMLYVSEYLPILASKLNLRCICDPDSNNKFEGEQLKGEGRLRKLKGNY